jgi:hypothetical protein
MSGVGASLADAARAVDAAPTVAHAESRDFGDVHRTHEHNTCGLCQLLMTAAHAAPAFRPAEPLSTLAGMSQAATDRWHGQYLAAASARAPPAPMI